jgi:hypothetical protein
MKQQQLIETLKAIGKTPERWQSSDGSSALVLPYGGRILGLFAPGDDENFLWTHASLGNADAAREFYEGMQWHNSGGDRTWLAPEVDFFFPEFPNLAKYWQQRNLDPGHYEVSKTGSGFVLVNCVTLSLSRPKQTVELEITKSLAPASNPLRYENHSEATGVKYAGYTLRTTLQIIAANPEGGSSVGLWNLLQLPHGGVMLVTTFSRAEPKVYMGSIGPEDLVVGNHLVRYKMRASGEHKLGIRDVASTGRVGYLCSADTESSLVVRSFKVNPSGEYVDVPWAETDNFGFVFQACNVNSNLGAFSELEYHVPAITTQPGLPGCADESQVWAFRGPEKSIKDVARRLLGPEV